MQHQRQRRNDTELCCPTQRRSATYPWPISRREREKGAPEGPRQTRGKGYAPGWGVRDAARGHGGLPNRYGSPETIPPEHDEGNITRCLSDWLDMPLRDISASDVRQRHATIGKRNGPYKSNSVFRNFRAVFNDAQATHPELQDRPNPCVSLRRRWFK